MTDILILFQFKHKDLSFLVQTSLNLYSYSLKLPQILPKISPRLVCVPNTIGGLDGGKAFLTQEKIGPFGSAGIS